MRQKLTIVETYEKKSTDKINHIWKKILNLIKRGFAKVKKSVTISKKKAFEKNKSFISERADEEDCSAVGLSRIDDVHTVLVYPDEKIMITNGN